MSEVLKDKENAAPGDAQGSWPVRGKNIMMTLWLRSWSTHRTHGEKKVSCTLYRRPIPSPNLKAEHISEMGKRK